MQRSVIKELRNLFLDYAALHQGYLTKYRVQNCIAFASQSYHHCDMNTLCPINDRPREKLLKYGPESLTEAELLALFIHTGTRGKSALVIAQELLTEYQTLYNIINLPAKQLILIKGIGPSKLSLLRAAFELGNRYLQENLQRSQFLNDAEIAKKFFICKLAPFRHEVFGCLFLTAKHEIIKFEILFKGSIHTLPIYPRVIAQKALEYNAQALVFGHNHPSTHDAPSAQDVKATKEIRMALKILDIQVIDHLVVGGNRCTSMVELGLISSD